VIIPDVLIQLSPWRWAQSCSKHVEDSNNHIIEEIVRQVGHLPELYEDTRAEKYKIQSTSFLFSTECHIPCTDQCTIWYIMYLVLHFVKKGHSPKSRRHMTGRHKVARWWSAPTGLSTVTLTNATIYNIKFVTCSHFHKLNICICNFTVAIHSACSLVVTFCRG
jgi:hypothetical protein